MIINRKSFSLFLYLGLSLLFLDCHKDHEDPYHQPPHAKIIVAYKASAVNLYNYYGTNERYNAVDTSIQDSTFYITKNPDGTYYLQGIQLFFDAQFDTSLYNASFEWKVGLDPTLRTVQRFALFFDTPYDDLLLRLITTYAPKDGAGEIKHDTAYQTIHVLDENPIIGEYRGINTDSTKDTFNIKIGWQYDADPRINRTYFSVSNLPKDFPIKNEVQPFSTTFGVVGETFIGADILYNGEYVNTVYALGFLNNSQDSIFIRYNYGVIKDRLTNANDWSRIVSHVFVGKKIL